jgi:hypothetical protein
MAIVQLANSHSKGEACDRAVDELLRDACHPRRSSTKVFCLHLRRAVSQAASAIPAVTPSTSDNVSLAGFVEGYRDLTCGEYFPCSPFVDDSSMTTRYEEVLDAYFPLKNVAALSNRKLMGT